MVPARVLGAVCAGLLSSATLAEAQATPRFRVDYWTTDDGLPSAFVSDLVSTRGGFLWLAAGGMVARFDGYTFRSYSTATDSTISSRVNQVYAGIGDTVWLSLDDGWIVSMFGGRMARLVQMVNGGLHQDDTGALLVGSYLGISRYEGGHLHPVALPPNWTMATSWSPRFRRDPSGVVWLMSGDGRPLRVTSRGAELGPGRGMGLLSHGADGTVLLSRRNGAMVEVVDARGNVHGRYRWERGTTAAHLDRNNRLWVLAPGEMRVYDADNLDPIERIRFDGASDVGTVHEDAAGNIWVAGVGLARIQEVPFRTVSSAPGLVGNDNQVDRLTLGPDGSILGRTVAGSRIGVYRFDGLRASLIAPGFMYGSSDSRGTVWISDGYEGHWGMTGRRPGAATIRLPHDGRVWLAEDPARPGSLWFERSGWFFRAEPYATGGPRVVDSLLLDGFVRTVTATADGVIWLAVVRSGRQQVLMRVAGDSIRTYTAADGVPSTDFRGILPDSDGTVWIGTYGAGLVRLRDGRFEAIHEQDGLSENIVSQILDDGAGNFWMAGNQSVHRVRIAEARAFLDGRVTRVNGIAYGRRDGLRNPETAGHEAVRARDGRLWFPTFGGAAAVDPVRAIALDALPPIMHVLGLRTASDTLLESRDLHLPRGERRLAIEYTGVSLRNPAGVRYEYKLDGVDDDWIHAGANRVAVYNDVGPGKHTFRVRAMNAGGVWSTQDATLDFTVPHFFYETIPFYLALAGLLAVAVRWAVMLRERQLRLRQDELTALVMERTGALSQALTTVEAQAAQLKTLDEAKSRFFANVSHEFRTPLSLILGPVEDIRDGRTGPVPDAARGKLDTVMSNVKRLVQLVEQLLDVARLESGTLQLKAEVRDLVPLLRRITESYGSLAERKGLSFQVTCPVGGIRVRYDPDQMEKIIGNLLGNALKFTPVGGRVELRARTEGDGAAGWAVVEVQDNGPGIPAAHQGRVFDRFYQVDDSTRRAHEGAGIGLALARELVDLHGGELALTSVEGAGSTFIVRLPLASSALHVSAETATQPPPRKMPVSGSSGRATPGSVAAQASHDDDRADVTTVLVAEDNAELLGWLRDRLTDHYRVIEAANGAIALALAREHVPDLIISDVMMPELDGQSLCEAVKKDPEIDFIPVILLTAKASRESRLAGLAGGADDYLAKPVDMHELLVRADNLIVSRRRLRERYAAAQRELPVLEIPLKPGPRDASADAFLAKMYAAIAAHVGDEAFQVDALASAVDMGRSTLYRKVEELLGRSPMDVVWEYRLEQAAQWLLETDANVSEVAYGVGFKSVPHFCSRFRTRYKATPSAYRRQRGETASAGTTTANH